MVALAVGLLVGVPLGSFLSAVFLRLALAAARMAGVSYWRALLAALTANYVLLALSLMFWLSAGYFLSLDPSVQTANMMYRISPIGYSYYVLGLVLVHGLVFSHGLAEDDGPLPFGKASYISLLYLSICFGAAALLMLLALILHAVS